VTDAERRAANEALYREVNERIREISKNLYGLAPDAALEMICECGLQECHVPFAITLADYERIRETPEWFVVLSGHELPEVEHVVERRANFVVVEKDRVSGAIARETDPRG
jgi:hypothetical protein